MKEAPSRHFATSKSTARKRPLASAPVAAAAIVASCIAANKTCTCLITGFLICSQSPLRLSTAHVAAKSSYLPSTFDCMSTNRQQGADRFSRGPLRRDGRALLALEREAETLGLGEVYVPNRPRSVYGICGGLQQIPCGTKLAKELVAGRALGCVRLLEAREEASTSVVQVKVAAK